MCRKNEVEVHEFDNCERLVNVTVPQTAALWIHNVELYHCNDGNYYAVCDKRFMFFKMENTVLRCPTEAKAREICEVFEYNKNYVEFRAHPQKYGCFDIDQGDKHPRQWIFKGNNFKKVLNFNRFRDQFFGSNG